MREVPCPACGGARLKPSTLAVTIGDQQHLRGVRPVDRRVGQVPRRRCELTERDRMIAERVIKEINARMGFLLDVGLDYLTLSRSAGTLAGGEAQRIRLACADRLAAWSACCTCSTSRRSASTSATTAA